MGGATASCNEAADLDWIEATSLTLVNGRYFSNMTDPYFRLPGEAQAKVRPIIWDLSTNSAGLAVAFETKASAIYVDYNLTGATLGMYHMPPTGVSGADLGAE